MLINIQNIFNAESRDIQSLFNPKPGVGFFIPIYQRQYTWGKKNIDRMMEDLRSCIERLKEYEDSVTFIGTVITVANNEGVAKHDSLINELPTQVHHVIDGQQRLTTYSVILMAYYSLLDEVNLHYKKDIMPNLSTPLKRWINSKVSEIQKTIKNSLSIEMGDESDPDYKFYPKITRADGDSWSKYEDDAAYQSPIAAFSHHFIKHHIAHSSNSDKFTIATPVNELHKSVSENYKQIRDELVTLSESEELISVSSINQSDKILSRFLNANSGFPAELTESEVLCASEIIRTVMLGNFILKRVIATFVEVSDDNYAFDMFEALNTTGEPLTAFETFKPKVVEYCNSQYASSSHVVDYQQTAEGKELNKAEALLSRYKKAEEKHKKTTALFQAFRLAYDAKSLSGHLSEQRRYINNAFEQCTEKFSFIQLLSSTSEFIFEVWENSEPSLVPQSCLANMTNPAEIKNLILNPRLETANFCIKVLKSANHKIVCGLFADFYNQFKIDNYSIDGLEKLIDIILATTSFFVRYRAFSSGTDGIDNVYREILGKSISNTKAPYRNTADIIEQMNKMLIEKGRGDEERWVKEVKSQDLYKNRKDLSKLMLLMAFENSTYDESNIGHLCNGTDSLDSYLRLKVWSEFNSVEHVWPQTPDTSWPESLDTTLHLNTLGNLSILPISENSILGNKPWPDKKSIYEILAEKNSESKSTLISEAVARNVLTQNQGRILKDLSVLHPHIIAISRCELWDDIYVSQRAENLLKRVWSATEKWL